MIHELAKLFKERDNKSYMGPVTGKVLSPPPAMKVQLGDKIILDNDHLVVAAHVIAGYKRNSNLVELNESTHIEFLDTVVKGDEVILIPSADEQTYYLIDKVVRF
jgi:hypothetical protein